MKSATFILFYLQPWSNLILCDTVLGNSTYSWCKWPCLSQSPFPNTHTHPILYSVLAFPFFTFTFVSTPLSISSSLLQVAGSASTLLCKAQSFMQKRKYTLTTEFLNAYKLRPIQNENPSNEVLKSIMHLCCFENIFIYVRGYLKSTSTTQVSKLHMLMLIACTFSFLLVHTNSSSCAKN